MKKITVLSLSIVFTLLLSSCSMHLGLSKLLGTSKSSTTTKVKHVKATHTPPSPSSVTLATPAAMLTPAPNTILITKQGYQPNSLTVKVGTTVTWTNADSAPHTVTADTAGTFDSGPITPNALYMYTFSQAGTFTYHSTSDTNVTGSVVVTP